MQEHWKTIPDFPGLYSASDLGRVRNDTTGRILKPRPTKNGYIRYALFVGGKTYRHALAHRLIWEIFSSPIEAGMQINHISGDKHDNRLPNLELTTPLENIRHYWRSRGYNPSDPLPRAASPRSGEFNGNTKLSASGVLEIKSLLASGISQSKIAKQFGVTQAAISGINRGKTWRQAA